MTCHPKFHKISLPNNFDQNSTVGVSNCAKKYVSLDFTDRDSSKVLIEQANKVSCIHLCWLFTEETLPFIVE